MNKNNGEVGLNTCNMVVCKKCGYLCILVGLLILASSLNLWSNAPSWFNGWTFLLSVFSSIKLLIL